MEAQAEIPLGHRSLAGRKILVTRAREQAAELSDLIRREGGRPVEFPVIRIQPPADWSAVDTAIRDLPEYDWVVFTSVNAVRLWMGRMSELGLLASACGPARIATIGPATAEELEGWGLQVDLVPPEYVAESVQDALLATDVRGNRILLPRAAEARELLAVGLRQAGASVTELKLYNTIGEDGDSDTLLHLLEGGNLDAVTFTSSSTVKNFVLLLPEDRARDLLAGTQVACIGPVTARTARELGIRVDAEAPEHTIPGLVEALKALFDRAELPR